MALWHYSLSNPGQAALPRGLSAYFLQEARMQYIQYIVRYVEFMTNRDLFECDTGEHPPVIPSEGRTVQIETGEGPIFGFVAHVEHKISPGRQDILVVVHQTEPEVVVEQAERVEIDW
jgi:hypothetical protein